MKTQKTFQLLVLMDFSEASYKALKYALSVAKFNRFNLHLFHVADGKEMIETENQVAALTAFKTKTRKINTKLNSIVEIIKAEGVPATSQYSLGNIVNEFQIKVSNNQPDIVVIGKRKENAKMSGKLTNYLINKYEGSLLVVQGDCRFQAETKISQVRNDKMLTKYDPNILLEFNNHTKSPLTFLSVVKPNDSAREANIPHNWPHSFKQSGKYQCEYEESSNIVHGITNHVKKKQIELLCIGREARRSYIQNLFSNKPSIISEVSKAVKIPLLIMGDNLKAINP